MEMSVKQNLKSPTLLIPGIAVADAHEICLLPWIGNHQKLSLSEPVRFKAMFAGTQGSRPKTKGNLVFENVLALDTESTAGTNGSKAIIWFSFLKEWSPKADDDLLYHFCTVRQHCLRSTQKGLQEKGDRSLAF